MHVRTCRAYSGCRLSTNASMYTQSYTCSNTTSTWNTPIDCTPTCVLPSNMGFVNYSTVALSGTLSTAVSILSSALATTQALAFPTGNVIPVVRVQARSRTHAVFVGSECNDRLWVGPIHCRRYNSNDRQHTVSTERHMDRSKRLQ